MLERIFLLSPANTAGKRASYVFNDLATFELARMLRTPAGAPLGDTFAFLSGLYFRGKLAYARHFTASGYCPMVITTDRGLLRADAPITIADLRAMSTVSVDPDDERYRRPLEDSARDLAGQFPAAEFVLLGSVASGKYVDILTGVLGPRLHFPQRFAGLGDMSRGGLLLRCVRENQPLDYVPLTHNAFRGTTAKKRRPSTA